MKKPRSPGAAYPGQQGGGREALTFHGRLTTSMQEIEMAAKTVTAETITQLEFVLSDIGSIAKQVHRLAIQLECRDGDPETEALMPSMIKALSERIGWASDLAGEKINSGFRRHESADGWMMPPAYHWAAERAQKEAS